MKNFEKLQRLLEELFQLDQADLDFGIYRIMNQKRDEVVRFLEKDLLPQVKDAFGQYKSADKVEVQKELDKAIEQATALGGDPESTAKVKELREKYDDSAVDVNALENEVFSHLFSFFRRYYHEGDFLSMRRYKAGVYAIPYEGEEVKLHWANHDQYYIKSSEYLRDFAFKLTPSKRVRFKVVSGSTEQDNKKEATGKERRFVLCSEAPMIEENGELVIRFEYRADDSKLKQDALNKAAVETLLSAEVQEQVTDFDWTSEFARLAPTKANASRTLLEKHLTHFTARNTFDYFIHKDLGGFLRRELDFYIKNEVMHLDDIEHDTVPRVEQYLSKIKVIRRIAHKVIQFLEQLENFQKKLWLKKKFVVETNYCITLDRIPEDLYAEIAANDAQREEWVKLFAIDEIEKDLNGPGYSNPLSIEFLRANHSLSIDTRYFGRDFTEKLLATVEDHEEVSKGLLINADNFQALSLIHARMAGHVDCIYIDPPYNTGGGDFAYKDNYQHSSWLSFILDRLQLASKISSSEGSFFASVDDNEAHRLRVLLDSVFGESGFESQIIVQSNKRGQTYKSLAKTHEYLFAYNTGDLGQLLEIPREITKGESDEFGNYELWELRNRNPKFGRFNRPNLFFPIFIDPSGDDLLKPDSLKRTKQFSVEALPHNSEGKESCWRWGTEKVAAKTDDFGCRHLIGKLKTSGEWGIFQKARKTTKKAKTIWTDTDVINERGTVELGDLGLTDFGFPKPLGLLSIVVQIGCPEDGVVLDFFAGSGTTAHAVIRQNRADSASRRFILVEQGNQFDRVVLPRVKKASFSSEWSSGKPKKADGMSSFVKYIRLESYEDALNNLELRRSDQQASLLAADDHLHEQFILSYMLDVESRGSQSLLNLDSIRKPDQYKLKVERNGESQLQNVDLVETFNWLLGLTVRHIDVIRGIRTVEGTNPDGDRVLVLWRDLDETDNAALGAWFEKQGYNTKDQEYDLLYVNGDNHLENLRRPDQTWKVRLIEEEFGRLMFDTEDQ